MPSVPSMSATTKTAHHFNSYVCELPQDEANYPQAVRSSCQAFVDTSPVTISDKCIDNFLTSLDKDQYEKLAYDSTMKMPLKFETIEDEINFVALIDLLNFGSGYRIPLHELAGRGAFDTIRFGCMSFHIGGKPMTAEALKNMTIFEVAEAFQIPIDTEVRHEKLDFVTVTEPTPLKPFAAGLTAVLNTTGDFLLNNNYKDLASFIMEHVKKHPQNAVSLVGHLTKALPGLHDCYQFSANESPVYLFKKAQIIVYHLWFTFKEQVPDLFDFKDIDELTVFSDNVIPTMLIHLGVITNVPEAWQDDIDKNKDLSVKAATTLRAAAVVACEEIVRKARSGLGPVNETMTTGGLDVYLWQLGKVGDFRKIHRFQLRDTVMF
ncbi:hypothetical protein BDF20DRAFT_900516 [Mycotypha africana]|uniref:uncharacterized protein n=1 Tax=Mycotypha africana TaxID=64632 RepID=UPI0023017419|nr:uncharacterized protein BDF20DRAFT_900516 [Mycotypha africana]KAI8967336.1 hypothetical protein BDF20DRAFT_900516 [Mycotypha africana]